MKSAARFRNRTNSVEQRLLQENIPARNRLYSAVALMVFSAALWLILAWLIAQIVARVFLAHATLADIFTLLAIMFALMLVRAALMWSGDVVAQRAANQFKTQLRERLLEKLSALGPQFTRGERTGELVHAATAGIETLDEYISQFQPARLLAGIVPVLVFIVILVLDPWTTPILLFTGPVLLVLLALIGGRARDLSEKRFLEMAWMSAHFLDMLQGLATLKMFGRSREQIQTIETISRHYGSTTMNVLRTAFQTSLVLEWGATAATALVAIQVSVRLMNGLMPFDLAFAVLLMTPEFFLPLRTLAIKYHAGTAGKTAAERIYAILDAPTSATLVLPQEKILDAPPTHFDISFDNVTVSYDGGTRRALENFSLHITHGQTVALVGATGAGKTTVANLLLRFIEPTGGAITIGGVPLKNISAEMWRAQVAWVPQLPHLFHGTLAENLRIAKPDAAHDEIIQAARAAHAHEFIEKLPQGYDTPVGERGARLSGGQLQRVAIARAFLKNAPFLILDEATSHLDRANQEHIRAALHDLMQQRTVLIISHRLKLAYDADVIAVMENGRVVELTNARSDNADSRFAKLAAAYERGV